MDAIRFYFTLLEKKLISPQNIHKICSNYCAAFLNHNGEFFNYYNKPLTKPMVLNFNNNPQNSLLVEFFCDKAITELEFYLKFKPDLVLPIIEEYIDRVPIIFPSIHKLMLKTLLEKHSNWFLRNFHKFYYHQNHIREYSILQNAASKLEDDPDNLKEIVNEAIKILKFF